MDSQRMNENMQGLKRTKLVRMYVYVEREWFLLCMRTDIADHLYNMTIASLPSSLGATRYRYNFAKKKGVVSKNDRIHSVQFVFPELLDKVL